MKSSVASPFHASISAHKNHILDMTVHSPAFDKKWGFSGWLGFKYRQDKTTFRLWSPTAESVDLILFASTDQNAQVTTIITMERGQVFSPENHDLNTHGLWEITLLGDFNNQSYQYRVYYRKQTFGDTRDPYSIATTADGKRSIVIAPNLLRPVHFQVKQGSEASWRLDNPNQAVIYEMHVRDFSKSETSGVSESNRGKFKGLIEKGTRNQYGDKTCFDYVKSLGITHIQLQPVFDHHQTFDVNGELAYNWGYDPENYNVPAASFTSDPRNPARRILELKEVIQAYHDAGLNVIMDVVYNHTYSKTNSAFQLAVPNYYYRLNPDGSFQNGSGCGNETASEKEMFRKYMVDSILYWIKEYNIDGFRFDLMGLHDIETMTIIRREVDEIDPRILLYGEGWDMGGGLKPENKAIKANAHLLPGIGFFNDDGRNAIKGAEVFGVLEEGFVSGQATEELLAKAILGSDAFGTYLTPSQVVNYVEAHDNYNLSDLLWMLHPDDDQLTHRKRVELVSAINLLMQGISFMQIGQEFLRSKRLATGLNGELSKSDRERAMNSYNAPDTVNQVNWNQITLEKKTAEFIKQVIKLKTSSPYFSYPTYEEVHKHLLIQEANPNSGKIVYSVEDERKLQIIYTTSLKQLQLLAENRVIASNLENDQENERQDKTFAAIVLDISK